MTRPTYTPGEVVRAEVRTSAGRTAVRAAYVAPYGTRMHVVDVLAVLDGSVPMHHLRTRCYVRSVTPIEEAAR